MSAPLILYSANTLLAYRINQGYYRERHFVWCNPYFSATMPSIDVQMPPSSTPSEICRNLFGDVSQQDLHSSRIQANRDGIRKGANLMRSTGEITDKQLREIEQIVSAAAVADFRPLLYVIPFHLIAERVKSVPPADRAHPFSREYIIADLPRSSFDVLEWSWR
jgi:hypothetical protein